MLGHDVSVYALDAADHAVATPGSRRPVVLALIVFASMATLVIDGLRMSVCHLAMMSVADELAHDPTIKIVQAPHAVGEPTLSKLPVCLERVSVAAEVSSGEVPLPVLRLSASLPVCCPLIRAFQGRSFRLEVRARWIAGIENRSLTSH